MKTYYEIIADGTIGRSTTKKEIAESLGLKLCTEREIVYGYDGRRYFKGTEPTPTPKPKKYEVASLFFWIRQYDLDHKTSKGEKVVDLLNKNNLYTVAVTTRYVSDDNELFAQTIGLIKGTVGFTDEEIEEALAYSQV